MSPLPAANRAAQAAGLPGAASAVVNAYWGRDRITFVERALDGGVLVREEAAEHSCFMRRADLSDEYVDRLRAHSSVLTVRPEGEWYRLRFSDRDSVKLFCAKVAEGGGQTFEGMVSPVVRAMADRQLQVARPRVAYLDLEADSRVPFSRKEQARILSWALVGAGGEEHLGMLVANTDRAERELLDALWEVLECYDLVAAWNGDRYDFPLLKHRSELRGLLGGRRDWRRWLWLDQLELYRRKSASGSESGDEKQSFALQAVCEALGLPGKNAFDSGKTWEAWVAGGERRAELGAYNLQDTRSLLGVEQKTGYVELLLAVGQACGTFADSRGVNPSVQVEGFLQRLAVQRGHKFPTREEREGQGQFRGAWVMEPKCAGIQRDVHVADFSRLYPSVIIAWNMSVETLLGVCAEDGALRRLGPHSYSPRTGACFSVEQEGILPAALKEMLRLRKYWSDLQASFPPGSPEALDAERRSMAYKTTTNSFYGVIGQAISRFFRREVAEACAQCGVWLIEATIAAAEERGLRVIYGDTDSLFVIGCSRAEFAAFVEWCNRELYPRMLREVGATSGRVDLGYEKAFDRLIIATKKRYIASWAHYKGKAATADSKPEIKGFEFKRGDSLRLARRLQEQVAHRLLGYRCEASDDPAHFEQLLERWLRRVVVEPLALEDVLVSKRLSREVHQYARKPLKDGSGFARQLPHIELARELGERGYDVGEGAKIEYVVVDHRSKPQRIVAAAEWDGQLDRVGLWASQVAPPTVRLLEAAFPGHDWGGWLEEAAELLLARSMGPANLAALDEAAAMLAGL